MRQVIVRAVDISVPATRQGARPRGKAILKVISAALILAACVPLPRSEPGIPDERLAPIEVGKTTQGEIQTILGEPTIIWESERIWVYEEGPSGAFLWIIPGVPASAIFLTELGDDVVIMRFDEGGTVERLDRRTAPVNRRHYGKFLRAWLAEGEGGPGAGGKSPTN